MREELSFAITQPIAHPDMFEAMGLQAGTGVLLFGPPGEAAAAGLGPKLQLAETPGTEGRASSAEGCEVPACRVSAAAVPRARWALAA